MDDPKFPRLNFFKSIKRMDLVDLDGMLLDTLINELVSLKDTYALELIVIKAEDEQISFGRMEPESDKDYQKRVNSLIAAQEKIESKERKLLERLKKKYES